MKRSLCAFIIASFAITTGYCFADDIWTINTVTYRQSGQPSVTVDINNNPVMAFTSIPLPYSYSTLYTAARTNTGYLVEQADSVYDAAWPKIAFTSNNELAMVFIRGSNYLCYASKSDWFDWSYWQIDSLQTGYIDMSLTNNDIPHLAYTARSGSIEHAFFDVHSQQWSKETLYGFGSPISGYARIDSDRSGKILVCYFDSQNVKTLCAVYSNGSWEYLPAIGSARYPDCGFTADSLPAVAYTKSNILCYAVYINSAVGWIETQVAPASSSFLMTSLNHSSTGIPGIAYINDGKLMYATNIAGGWTITEIDTLSSIPYSSFDLIFDKNDKPLIAYNGTDTRFGWNLSAIKLAGIGLANTDNTFDISGTITDHLTGLPIENASVQWHCQNLGAAAITETDVNGFYKFEDMPPGVIDIYVSAGSYTPANALNMTFEADIDNLDFALIPYSSMSGKVLDNATAQPIPNVIIEYENEKSSLYFNTISDANGCFYFPNLLADTAEIKTESNINTGYASNLPWGANLVNLKEGEQRTDRIIFLEKGAIVKGSVKDANGNPFANLELYADGRNCESWIYTDANGFYQIRLPKGDFSIQPDDEEIYGMLPIAFTITDINTDVNLPDGFVYTSATGKHISGEVNNPGDYLKNGTYEIQAFKAGTNISDANSYYIDSSAAYVGILNEGAFSINNLPPDVNYDIYLMAYTAFPDGRDSQTIRDVVFNVSPDTNNVYLQYNSTGNTVSGRIKNINDAPVLGAAALLFNSLGDFKGFCQTDCNGLYTIYNVPAGNYTITAIHSKYTDASTVIDVNDADVNAPEIVIPFAGGKEGPDLNGNGVIDLFDIAEFSGQWLDAGVNEANFNNDEFVNFYDWLPLANNWLWKAIWLNE